jgi:hypothetical protein
MPFIRWYRARGTSFPCSVPGGCAGLWQAPNRIILARGEELHREVVTHEMVHQLMPERDHGDSVLEEVLARCTKRGP